MPDPQTSPLERWLKIVGVALTLIGIVAGLYQFSRTQAIGAAKPFLEKWMIDQLGPRKLLEQLRAEAPRFAKLLPQLPRLLHDYLEHRPADHRRELAELLAAQKRTNKLL